MLQKIKWVVGCQIRHLYSRERASLSLEKMNTLFNPLLNSCIAEVGLHSCNADAAQTQALRVWFLVSILCSTSGHLALSYLFWSLAQCTIRSTSWTPSENTISSGDFDWHRKNLFLLIYAVKSSRKREISDEARLKQLLQRKKNQNTKHALIFIHVNISHQADWLD